MALVTHYRSHVQTVSLLDGRGVVKPLPFDCQVQGADLLEGLGQAGAAQPASTTNCQVHMDEPPATRQLQRRIHLRSVAQLLAPAPWSACASTACKGQL